MSLRSDMKTANELRLGSLLSLGAAGLGALTGNKTMTELGVAGAVATNVAADMVDGRPQFGLRPPHRAPYEEIRGWVRHHCGYDRAMRRFGERLRARQEHMAMHKPHPRPRHPVPHNPMVDRLAMLTGRRQGSWR